jgi:RNA polymerase sigma-70 factor, ECF subfamily
MNDAALVAEVYRRGAEAFAPIVERYKEAVFAVALSRLRRFDDAEDVAQATFIEAFERLKNLKDPHRLGAWLRSIAIHRSIDCLRRMGRHVALDETGELESKEPGVLAQIEKRELRAQVLEAVGRLPRTQGETVVLYYISGYSQGEVAAILEVPLGTVKRRLHQARKRLKEDMLGMVEEILKEEAPKDDFAAQVFDLLNCYPREQLSREQWRAIEEELHKVGTPGIEGFIKALEVPHWPSRRMAMHMVDSALPDKQEAVIGILKKALGDPNRRVRSLAVGMLCQDIDVPFERKRDEFLPLLAPLLLDRSKRVRRMVVMMLIIWRDSGLGEHVPLEIVAEAHLREEDARIRQWMGTLLERRLQAIKNS